MHTPPLIGHQAAKWGVKYNFHACWRLLIKHFLLQLPSAYYSLAFDIPIPPLFKETTFTQRGSGLALTCGSQALWCSSAAPPLSRSPQ